MKAFSIIALLVLSFFAHATSKAYKPDPVIRSSSDITYVCKAYTNNEAKKEDPNSAIKITTDNPVQHANTTIIQTKLGFIIRRGQAFSEEKVLTNSQLGSVSGMAGDPTTLIVKKEEVPGVIYFTVFLFETPESDKALHGVGPVKTLVTVAACEEKE